MHDVVIVGAGTAGCVLASELSRSGRLKVLLLEAGGKPDSMFVRMPAGFGRLFKSKLDWAFESEPQSAVSGRRIFTPRGKMLGGSSNMNAQIHQWCHPADFDGWVAAGAAGWGWKDVAPVFRLQEGWVGDDPQSLRGREGPMTISPNRNTRPLSRAFVEAARAQGLGNQAGYNGGPYAGAWLCELAHRDGRRFSAFDAYLVPAMKRPNLEVVTGAHALRLVVKQGRATGVVARRDGAEVTYQGRGIVVSAGAFGSPQLLMLSGIGPAAQLRELGIPVVADVPEVGSNLQDHPLAALIYRTPSRDTLKAAESPLSLLRYLLFRSGMLASNAIEAFAFTSTSGAPDAPPDLEIILAPLEWRAEGLEPPRIHAVSLGIAVVAPVSRGRLTLRSSDPLAPPRIDFGLLGDPDGVDAAVIVAGLRLARRIAATPPLAQDVAEEMVPGASVVSDDEIRSAIAEHLQTVYHPTSTCRMGSDARAVVTPVLQARAVDALWVADASVMPSVPRGHPNAVVAMLAHRAAGFIDARLTA